MSPLSFGQEQQYLGHLFAPGRGQPVWLAADLHGDLDVPAFERALTDLVHRHEALRARFTGPGEPTQRITPPGPVALAKTRVTADSAARFAAYLRTLRHADTVDWPLWTTEPYRFRLIRRAPDEHVFVASYQHILADAHTVDLCHDELWRLYACHAHGADELPPVTRPFHRVVADQRAIPPARLRANERYWTDLIASAPPVFQFDPRLVRGGDPATPVPDTVIGFSGAELTTLRGCVEARGCSALEWVLTCLAAVLFDVGLPDRLAVHLPVDARRRDESATAGMLVAIHPVVLDRSATTAELLGQVRTQVLRRLAHQHVPPAGPLATHIGVAHGHGLRPSRSISLNYRRGGRAGRDHDLPGLRVRRRPLEPTVRTANLLYVSVFDQEDRFTVAADTGQGALAPGELADLLAALRDRLLTGADPAPARPAPLGLVDLGGVFADPAAIRRALLGHPAVTAAQVSTQDGHLRAAVTAAAPVTAGELRRHLAGGTPGPRVITIDQPGRPAEPGLLTILSRRLGGAGPEDDFWQLGGTFADIEAVRREAADLGLPVPGHERFAPPNSLHDIAA